jgi:hypothetical protein
MLSFKKSAAEQQHVAKLEQPELLELFKYDLRKNLLTEQDFIKREFAVDFTRGWVILIVPTSNRLLLWGLQKDVKFKDTKLLIDIVDEVLAEFSTEDDPWPKVKHVAVFPEREIPVTRVDFFPPPITGATVESSLGMEDGDKLP